MLFVVPVGLILAYSFFQRSATGGIDYTFTLDNYVAGDGPALPEGAALLAPDRVRSPRSIALVLGYTVAYFIATRLGAVADSRSWC